MARESTRVRPGLSHAVGGAPPVRGDETVACADPSSHVHLHSSFSQAASMLPPMARRQFSTNPDGTRKIHRSYSEVRAGTILQQCSRMYVVLRVLFELWFAYRSISNALTSKGSNESSILLWWSGCSSTLCIVWCVRLVGVNKNTALFYVAELVWNLTWTLALAVFDVVPADQWLVPLVFHLIFAVASAFMRFNLLETAKLHAL